MKQVYILFLTLIFISCGDKKSKTIDAQTIVDRAIVASGGDLYEKSEFSFKFRNREYLLQREKGKKILKRITATDTASIVDIRSSNKHSRYINDSLVSVPDTMATKYANSINSVHYFAYLPYGLNDRAVNKKLLGEEKLKGKTYYKIEVTFDQEGGGDDFDDIYVYWFDKETFKPDYLAYEFHVDGGGIRFREAYNERYISGIRFVDYSNYKPESTTTVYETGKLFEVGELEMLSKIELDEIVVTQDNYN